MSVWRRVLLVLGGLWTIGCFPEGDAPPVPEILPLQVEYAGCQTVLRGPICVLKESRELRLWIHSPATARLELTAGGRRLTDPGTAVRGGLRFQLAIPEAATELSVRATGVDAVWTLALKEPDRPAWLGQAEEWRAAGEIEPARRLLEEKAASSSRVEQALALGRLVRLELFRGEASRARELLVRAIQAHHDTGRVFDELKDTTVLVYLLIQKRNFSAARAALDALPPPEDGPAEAAYFVAYYRGLLAGKIGDSRSALRHLTEAAEQAERVDLVRERQLTEQVLGWNLQRLGRSQEAARLFSRLHEEESRPCDRALLLTNHAWSLLLALEAGEPADDPTPLLEEALGIWTAHSGDCVLSADQRVNALINLALAHLHGHRPDEARSFLEQARKLTEENMMHHVLWRLDIKGRLALDAGRPAEALELYAELAKLAVNTLSPEARWRAAIGRARSHEALDQRSAALAALAEAEALLDEESLQVPLDEGRETFLAQREPATRFYLDLLLDSGRSSEAFALARRARSRVLRDLRRGDRLAHLAANEQNRWDRAIAEYQELREQIDAEAAADWRLPTDQLSRARAQRATTQRKLRRILDEALSILDVRGPEPLPPPRTGELILAYHPLPRGWVGFAATTRGVKARRLGPLKDDLRRPAELSARLLGPFATEIGLARRVRVLPYGPLRSVDFHALPFGDEVLLSARPVVYGLDMAPPPAPQRAPQALLVADPNGNLPAARTEVEAVRRALEADPGGWSLRTMEGSQAHGDVVRRALAEATLFHYAGHATFAGRGGWESALPLAENTRLTVGDILALKRAPELVVLSGCETGRSAREAPLESIGLAHAFVAAGSRRVIAAVRPVADRAAAELVAALYRDGAAAPDIEAALRRAQLAWRRQDPAADWSSFRVIEP